MEIVIVKTTVDEMGVRILSCVSPGLIELKTAPECRVLWLCMVPIVVCPEPRNTGRGHGPRLCGHCFVGTAERLKMRFIEVWKGWSQELHLYGTSGWKAPSHGGWAR